MRWVIYFLFFCVSDGGAQNVAYVTDANIVASSVAGTDTIYYLKKTVTEGSWIVYYDSTKTRIAFTSVFYGGNRSDSKSWYANGQPREFRLNNDSVPYYKQDHYGWYSNGEKRFEEYTTRDTFFFYQWWKNGQLACVQKIWGVRPWKHDTGNKTEYLPSGVLYRRVSYYPDSTIVQYIHPNGQLGTLSKARLDSLDPDGAQRYYMHSFHPNGQESSTELYPDRGRQPVTYYYPSGKKSAEGDWMEGKIGRYTEWHENGKVKAEGVYSMGIKKFTHVTTVNYYPTKTGHWIYYNEAGWIEKEEWRDFDGSVRYKEYDENGKVIFEGERQEVIPPGVVFPKEYRQ